jgi:co-chaperonin GroES (HSP10)
LQEGRLITGDQREFVVAAWSGTNESGYQPLDDKVLVLMDEHATETAGGVYIPDHAAARQTMASETGVIVAMGAAAFEYDDDVRRKWVGHRPEPGDRVYVSRYAGQLLQGVDGRTYRLMSQACIGAVATPAAVQEMVEAQSFNPARKRGNGEEVA